MFKLNYLAITIGIIATRGLSTIAMASNAKTYVNVSTGFCLDSNTEGKVYGSSGVPVEAPTCSILRANPKP